MNHNNPDFIENVSNLEEVVQVCLGRPADIELPQTASEHEVILNVLHKRTGQGLDLIEARINHQTAK